MEAVRGAEVLAGFAHGFFRCPPAYCKYMKGRRSDSSCITCQLDNAMHSSGSENSWFLLQLSGIACRSIVARAMSRASKRTA
jgi:hypothetical protein